jgi:hypothetical protein
VHPLAGVHAKIDRASEHLDALNDEWAEVLRVNAKDFLGPIEVNPETEWYLLRFGPFDPDMVRYSVIAGEMAYALRSALEHLVWALVKRSHRAPTTGNQFPIETKRTLTPDQFIREHRNGLLRGVPLRVIRVIEQYQPYNAPDPPSHFLTIIKTFADVDKHRTLFVSYVAPHDPSQLASAIHFDPPPSRTRIDVLLKRGQRLKPGTKLVRFRAWPFILQRDVHVDGKLTLLVNFREAPSAPRGPEGDFRDHIEDMRSLVKDFERRFFS